MSYLLKPENRPNKRIETKNELAEAEQLLAMNGEEYDVEELDDETESDPDSKAPDGGATTPDVVDDPNPVESEETHATALQDDPIEFLRKGNEELVTNIKGTTVIKKKGFRLLQHEYDISTDSEVVVGPEETDMKFCRVKARAELPSGQYAEAHASASLTRGDDKGLLVSMADTRAKSRALSDLTGSGALAMEETHGTELEQ